MSPQISDAFPMPGHLFPLRQDNTKEDDSGSSESRPETPLGHLPIIPTSPLQVEIPSGRPLSVPDDVISLDITSPVKVRVIPVPPSPTASTTSTEFSSFTEASDTTMYSASSEFTTSSTVTRSGDLTIKVAHNQSIILLRTSRDTELSDVRQRIYDKFLTQEKITLSDAFAVAFVLLEEPRSPPSKGKGRARSSSVGSGPGPAQMVLVTNQADWERALSTTESAKITVRVLDTFHE